MNVYSIAKLENQPSGSPVQWDAVQPLRIRHYLWKDNGYEPEVYARLGYTPDKLHVCFRTYETDPLIRYHQMNDPVYTDSCVEFFVQPVPGSDRRYFNFELNAAGTLLLGLGIDRDRIRLQGVNPEQFGIQSAVNCADASGKIYWQLEFSIPFAFVREYFHDFRPASGTVIRGNFYKCGDQTPLPHYGCWNRIEGDRPDFHQQRYFGTLVFE